MLSRKIFEAFDRQVSVLTLEEQVKVRLHKKGLAVFHIPIMTCRTCRHGWASGCVRFSIKLKKRRVYPSKQYCSICPGLVSGIIISKDKRMTEGVAKKIIDRILGRRAPPGREKKLKNHRSDLCELCISGQYCPGRQGTPDVENEVEVIDISADD